jgi:hypothetical protein
MESLTRKGALTGWGKKETRYGTLLSINSTTFLKSYI